MKGHHHEDLVHKAQGLAPLRTAVVHPVDEVSLAGAIEAGKEELIAPVLVGPEHKIRAAAEAAKLDLSGYEIVATIATPRRRWPSRWRLITRSRR